MKNSTSHDTDHTSSRVLIDIAPGSLGPNIKAYPVYVVPFRYYPLSIQSLRVHWVRRNEDANVFYRLGILAALPPIK